MASIRRRALVGYLALGMAAGLGLSCEPTEPALTKAPAQDEDRPPALLPTSRGLNVIVISFDALRPDVLGAYGGTRGASPHIDRFAEQSLVFEQAYSVAPVTPTSFAAAFTGFLPSRVFHAWELRANETLASYLSHAGYHTVAFLNNVQLTAQRDFDRGFDQFFWSRNDPDEAVLQRVSAWLSDAPPKPFFLWVHFLAPHAPYRARPAAAHLYRSSAPGRFEKTTGNVFETTDPAERARIYDLYLGEVWRADRIFGRLVQRLRELDLWSSSLVALTSDHGEEFGEHGGFQHGRLYEEHLRVPLILHHPEMSGRDRSERRISSRVRNVDLLPSLLHTVGYPVENAFDGRVIPRTAHSVPPLIAISMTGNELSASITKDSTKLILTCNGRRRRYELYDLDSDPAEQSDLARHRPQAVRLLTRTLRTLLGGPTCKALEQATQGRNLTVGLDKESIEALRALGYLD